MDRSLDPRPRGLELASTAGIWDEVALARRFDAGCDQVLHLALQRFGVDAPIVVEGHRENRIDTAKCHTRHQLSTFSLFTARLGATYNMIILSP